jgi:hypothetical protein
MSKFVCENKDCPKFGIEEEYFSNTYKMVNGELQSNNAPCPRCGQIRKEINPNMDIPLRDKNIEIAKYSSASPEQKREMLKQRSHEDYEKHVKERKDGLMNQAISEMRNIAEKK